MSNITGESGKHAVSIQSDDVTLDLNGFAVIGGGGGLFRGIDVPAVQNNLCVRNGTVRGWTGGGVRTTEPLRWRNISVSLLEAK